jgi:hypothetical protein
MLPPDRDPVGYAGGWSDYVIPPIAVRTSVRCRVSVARRTMPAMDTVGLVLIAVGSLACLELAAYNLRGEARRPRNSVQPRTPDRRPAPRSSTPLS